MLKTRRCFATLIDLFSIALGIGLIASLFRGSKVGWLWKILFAILFIVCFLAKDLLFRGASIGKKLLGLKIVMKGTEEIPPSSVLIRRTLYWKRDDLFNFHLCGERSSDVYFNTKVVSVWK